MSKLFSSYTIRNIELPNRIVMSPMCMYSSADDGQVADWHRIHYASRAVGQVGLVMLEASAVTPQGRISARDLGIWGDEHIAGLSEVVRLIHTQGAKAAIQLGHAGRKANIDGPIVAPSAIAFGSMKTPEAMSRAQIKETVKAFAEAAARAKAAGFDCIELHGAHGYLLNQFLSPISNHRADDYGSDRDGRYRLLGEVIDAVRPVFDGALFVRISADEYDPSGNRLEDYIYFARLMKEQGVDLIDCSSGGIVTGAPAVYPGYQVPLAEQIRRAAGIATGAVGLITSGLQAEEILGNERADLIFIGRSLLKDPYWPRAAARELGEAIAAPAPYERGW